MIKSLLNISGFLLLPVLLLISNNGNAQDIKKGASEEDRVNKYKLLGTLLESRRFVFEREDTLTPDLAKFQPGNSLVFMEVDSLRIFVHFVIESGKIMTWRGFIENWQIDRNDKLLNYDLQISANNETQILFNLSVNYSSHAKLISAGAIYYGYINSSVRLKNK